MLQKHLQLFIPLLLVLLDFHVKAISAADDTNNDYAPEFSPFKRTVYQRLGRKQSIFLQDIRLTLKNKLAIHELARLAREIMKTRIFKDAYVEFMMDIPGHRSFNKSQEMIKERKRFNKKTFEASEETDEVYIDDYDDLIGDIPSKSEQSIPNTTVQDTRSVEESNDEDYNDQERIDSGDHELDLEKEIVFV